MMTNLHLHILNSLNGGVLFADNDHVIRYMDEEAMDHFKKSGGQGLIGRNLSEFHRPASLEKIKEYQQQMMEGKLEEVMVRKMDQMHAFMKAVRNEEGQLIGYMECFKPIKHESTPLKENLYQKSYKFYDELQQLEVKKDIAFYESVIPVEAKVLELGCGTGRVGYELAKRGNRVVGLDLSKEMLNVYHEKIVNHLDEIKGSIKTVHSDMAQFDMDQKFDWIIFPFRVFQMLLTEKFMNQCLASVKRHLEYGGQVIIDVFNPDLNGFKDWEHKSGQQKSFLSSELKAMVTRSFQGVRHFEKQQIISYKYIYEIQQEGQEPITFEEPMRMAYFNGEQMEHLLKTAGFLVQSVYGDWDFTPVDTAVKKELIYVLKQNE